MERCLCYSLGVLRGRFDPKRRNTEFCFPSTTGRSELRVSSLQNRTSSSVSIQDPAALTEEQLTCGPAAAVLIVSTKTEPALLGVRGLWLILGLGK